MPLRSIKEFIRLEASGGMVLCVSALLALIISNSPWQNYYHQFFNIALSINLGPLSISKPLLLWINEGLMTIFFLLVGLEIKRELLEGELNSFNKAIFPAIAAFGGMLIPALVYIVINHQHFEFLRGWAIPTATDIAFSLGILSLFGKRVPAALKIFLLALAIFDDVGAIIIIAVFYTSHISVPMLLMALFLLSILVVLNRLHITNYIPYFLIGIILWFCVLKSGVHATLSGIILALVLPMHGKNKQYSPLINLEHMLNPWVAFLILPIFAFANSGVTLHDLGGKQWLSPLTLGIILGLFIGKPLGIMSAIYVSVKSRLITLSRHMTWPLLFGVSIVAGVGFTMSLFIGTLAFGRMSVEYLPQVRLGVLSGSLLSGIVGYIMLYKFLPKEK